jgi:predicted nuclease with TOPRIM domain
LLFSIKFCIQIILELIIQKELKRMHQKFKAVVKSTMVLFVLICLCYACGGKYDDVIKVNEEFAEILEKYASNLQKADNAKDVAAAINDVSEDLEKLAPRMKKLQEKYPELKTQKDLPPELIESQKSMEKIGEKLAGSFMTLVKYLADPDVQAAQVRFGKAMQSSSL